MWCWGLRLNPEEEAVFSDLLDTFLQHLCIPIFCPCRACEIQYLSSCSVMLWHVLDFLYFCHFGKHVSSGNLSSCLELFFFSGKDTLVKWWDLDTQHCFKTLVGHRTEVKRMCGELLEWRGFGLHVMAHFVLSLLSGVVSCHCDMFCLSLGFRDEQRRNFQTFQELSSTCSGWHFQYRCPRRKSWLDWIPSWLPFK